MSKEVSSYIVKKTHELTGVPTRDNGIKVAAKAWLDTVGTENEAAETKKYADELEADTIPIDGLIGFAESGVGSQVFRSGKTKDVAAHTKEVKAIGAKFCDCPTHAAVETILNKREDPLK